MGSLSRKLRKLAKGRDRKLSGYELQGRILDALLFDETAAPSEEHRQERADLVRRYRQLLAEYREKQPAKLWAYLSQAYRGYDPKHDGPSNAMRLVADVRALRADEEHLKDVRALLAQAEASREDEREYQTEK